MPELSFKWLTAQKLVGLPGMPSTTYGVRVKAKNERWESRKKAAGKGLEYCINSLPQDTQAHIALELARQQKENSAAERCLAQLSEELEAASNSNAESTYDREAEWDRYARAKNKIKQKAEHRLRIVQEVAYLVDTGLKLSPAVKTVATARAESADTIERWYRSVKDMPRHDWLAILCPNYQACGRPSDEINPSVLRAFITLYYRPEQPFLATVHRKLKLAAKQQGIEIPEAKKLKRAAEREIPLAQRVSMREGERGLLALYPKQERTVIAMHALDSINGDGYEANVMVRWPDGEIRRPHLWVWQDVYSRSIVGWAVDKTENTDLIRKAFLSMATEFGLPNHIYLDNTRAASNQELMGGVHTRYRVKNSEDQPLGAWPLAGIECHTTGVTTEGNALAWAKPVERVFGRGGISAIIDQDYALRGAYTGPSPMDKPANYGEAVVELDVYLAAVARGIAEFNAQQGRRSEMGQGIYSYEEVFKKSYEVSAPVWPTRQQMRLFENSSESARVQKDGTVAIKAGQIVGKGMKANNRYGDESLMDFAGQLVRVWYNPLDLHSDVDIYSHDGQFICEARCLEKAGFADREAKRAHNRARTGWIRLNKKAAKEFGKMEDLEADRLLSYQAPEPIEIDKRLVRPFRPVDATITRTRHEQTLTAEEQADVAAKVAQINTELNALNNATEIVDRSNISECVLLYGKLMAEVETGIALTAELQGFCTWFEEESDYMKTYELLKDDIDFASGGLPIGRAKKSPR